MRHNVQLAVQEQYLQGETMIEKWDHARRLGFDAIELRGAGEDRFAARLDELKTAAAAGAVMPTVCVEMLHFVGDFDPDKASGCAAANEISALGDGRDRWPIGHDTRLVRDVQQATATVHPATIR